METKIKRWLGIGFFLSLFFYIMSCTIIEEGSSLPTFALTPSEITLDVGGSSPIGISDEHSYYSDKVDMIKWEVDDPNIAIVTNGEVVAVGSGITTITASYIDTSATQTAKAVVKVRSSAPENLISTCNNNLRINLSWKSSKGAGLYKIYRNSTNSTNIASVFTDSYVDTGLTAGKEYTYKVQSCIDDSTCSEDFISKTFTSTNKEEKTFGGIIHSGETPKNFDGYDKMSTDIFSRYNRGNRGIPIVARYLKPGRNGDGSSFNHPAGNLKTVLEGINDAAANKVYAIILAGGNYKAGSSMAMQNHVAIIGGVNECLESSSGTITALDGDNSYRVFHNNNNGLDKTALLYGVTITNGRENNDNGNGGGMYNYRSSPSLVGVTFSGNWVKWKGGGMYNYKSSPSLERVAFSENTAYEGGGMHNTNSSPSLTRVTFSGNTASSGGGIYNISSSPNLSEVTFSGNTAELYGGGIQNYESSPDLSGGTFSGNTADYGGGIYNQKHSSPTLVKVTFSGNVSTNSGGGMYNSDNSSPKLEGVTFSGNTAKGGGGMYNNDNSSPKLEGVTFSGNTAKGGGGMANISSSPSLVRVTFSGNAANDDGGGMYNNESSPSLVSVVFFNNTANDDGAGLYNQNFSSPILVGVTFFTNKAGKNGGGMYNDNGPENINRNIVGPLIINGIFWGNTALTGPQFYFHNVDSGKEVLSIYNSIVAGGTGTLVSEEAYNSINQGGFVSGGRSNSSRKSSAYVKISFSNIITTDPELGELVDNNGVTWTYAIASTSPAVNQGLYVKRKATTVDDKTEYTLYYSTDESTWYTQPDLSGTVATVPKDAEDVTATDATGYTRKDRDRPDIGAYEVR